MTLLAACVCKEYNPRPSDVAKDLAHPNSSGVVAVGLDAMLYDAPQSEATVTLKMSCTILIKKGNGGDENERVS